ncbi:pyridoxal-dependent decarboxylase, exosortase A system-associated [Thermaurantiacus sp.]
MSDPDSRMPSGFARDQDGRLLIAGRPAEAWAEDAGDTPLFVYDMGLVRARIAAVRAAMPPALRIHYAVKANPMPELLRALAPLVDGFDVASAGELARATAAGMAAHAISFAGPGKRDRELVAAIGCGAVLSLESAGEAARAHAIAARLGRQATVLLRINPPFELRGAGMRMGGGARPFGVDAADAPAVLEYLADPVFDFMGFHVFAGSQNLDAEAIAEAQAATLDLVAGLAAAAPAPVRLVNLGGGLGVPYFPADRPLDLEAVGTALSQRLAARPAILGKSAFALELGRYLVAEAGVYLTRVIDRKHSAGKLFLVTDGGLHHQLAASGNFGTVIRRNYPLVNALRSHGPFETANVVGCLCTPLDRLADAVTLPETAVGDLLALFMAGAYGRTASPEAFLGHPPPAEILADPLKGSGTDP